MRPCPRFVGPRLVVSAGGRIVVSAYVVCACRRVWVGCPWSMCAPRARHRPNSSLPCCPPGPRLGFKLFSGFLGNSARPPPPCSPGGGLWQPSPHSPPGVLRAARGWDRIGGWGNRQRLRTDPSRGWAERAAHASRTCWEERGKQPVLAPDRGLKRGEDRAAGVARPTLLGESVCDRERCVCLAERPATNPRLRFEIRSPFVSCPGRGAGARGVEPSNPVGEKATTAARGAGSRDLQLGCWEEEPCTHYSFEWDVHWPTIWHWASCSASLSRSHLVMEVGENSLAGQSVRWR